MRGKTFKAKLRRKRIWDQHEVWCRGETVSLLIRGLGSSPGYGENLVGSVTPE